MMPVSPTSFNGQLLSSISLAAAMNPAAAPQPPRRSTSPVRNSAWDQVRMDVPVPAWQPPRPQVSLPRPQPAVPDTLTSVSGMLASSGTVLESWVSPAVFGQTKAPSSPGFLGSMGSWLWGQASGAFETVRYGLPFVGGRNDGFLSSKQNHALSVAKTELAMGSKERGSTNTGKRVDLYARACKMNTGHEWCGFFVGFAYSQNGFKKPEYMASGYKAQLFYLYRTMKSADTELSTHRSQGQTRQYFMLPESPSRNYVKSNAKLWPHFDLNANTFNWNTLPIRPGDTILFERGKPTGIPDHVGMVESYDRTTGRLVTVEGNVENKVVRKVYDLSKASVRKTISGFGRPAPGDFV